MGKTSVSDQERLVLEYMRQQNRPYSATDVQMNMQRKMEGVSKGAVVKVLNQLSTDGHLLCKTYGKQLVYVIKQDDLPSPSPEELKQLDAAVADLRQQLVDKRQRVHEKQSQLAHLLNELPTKELKERVQELTGECAQLQQRLDDILAAFDDGAAGADTNAKGDVEKGDALAQGKRAGETTAIGARKKTRRYTDDDRQRIEQQLEARLKTWRQRKRLFKDVINAITETAAFGPKQLMEELGMETEEDVGLDMQHCASLV